MVEGHDSRLHNDFLEYIKSEGRKCTVCIGVPSGTSYWKVGDSKDQNGTFKIILKRNKHFTIENIFKVVMSDLQVMPTGVISLGNNA